MIQTPPNIDRNTTTQVKQLTNLTSVNLYQFLITAQIYSIIKHHISQVQLSNKKSQINEFDIYSETLK